MCMCGEVQGRGKARQAENTRKAKKGLRKRLMSSEGEFQRSSFYSQTESRSGHETMKLHWHWKRSRQVEEGTS